MQSQAPLCDVLNYLPDGILMVDERGVILFANDAFTEMLGYAHEMLVGLNILSLLVDIDVFRECSAKVMQEGKSLDSATDFRHSEGHTVHTVKSVRMIRQEGETRLFVNVRNLAEVDQSNKELRDSKEMIEHQARELSSLLNSKHQELEEILRSINEVIWYIDNQTFTLRYVNDAVEELFGFSKEMFLSDQTLWQRQIHPDDQGLVQTFFETLHPGQSQEIRFRIYRSNNELRWLNSRIHHHPKLNFFIGITSDITISKAQSEEISFLAYHDPLTHLPNRAKLKLLLEDRLEYSDSPFALLFLDLDNFKNINDSMGHEIGDKILIEVARRLKAVSEENGLCARFGGDEFVVLLPQTDREELDRFCHRLIRIFKDPFTISDADFFLSASIGIVLHPDDAANVEDLIKHADTAMYEAKKKGKNQFVYYHSSMQYAIHNFLFIESLMREGLTQKNFRLHFQPLVNSTTLRLEGYEALLRLPDPSGGFVPPEAIISVAETNGYIHRIGKEVLSQACDFIEEVRAIRTEPFFVAINISAKQLHQENFAKELLDYLALRSVPTSYLKIELTESAVMENVSVVTEQLRLLKDAELAIALDDFGTGYSSFAHLAQLPIDTLKIDKSFILKLSDSNRHIIEAMSNLAHMLGMSVTAEGVEETVHFDFLIQNRVDTLQGYYLSRPLPKEETLRRLTENSDYFIPSSDR